MTGFGLTNRETFVDRERVSSSHVGFGMGYPGPFYSVSPRDDLRGLPQRS